MIKYSLLLCSDSFFFFSWGLLLAIYLLYLLTVCHYIVILTLFHVCCKVSTVIIGMKSPLECEWQMHVVSDTWGMMLMKSANLLFLCALMSKWLICFVSAFLIPLPQDAYKVIRLFYTGRDRLFIQSHFRMQISTPILYRLLQHSQ